MNIIISVFNSIAERIGHDVGTVSEIVAVLSMILLISVYEFVVYRLVSHRSMYNKSFHISIVVIPFFIGAIIMALQSNVVITLGTIGALAIIRYRTAIKDPVDMIYVLWSVFIGITCGCQLYELCLLTSFTVTVVLITINLLSGKFLKNPYVLVINSEINNEIEITNIIKDNCKKYKLKSRNFTSSGVDFIYQIETKNPTTLTDLISKIKDIKQFSLIEYDNDDAI